ncbi:ATP-binding protein [Escherichia coli]
MRCQTVNHQVQVSVEHPWTPIAPSTYRDCLTVLSRFTLASEKVKVAVLGLAIVKSIVVAHKGTVAVTSDARGTRFVITLPA